MSFMDNTGVKVFPKKIIDSFIEQYKEEHKCDPTILVVSEDDYLDWCFSSFAGRGVFGQEQPTYNGLTIIPGKYLKPGEIELAEGVKDISIVAH